MKKRSLLKTIIIIAVIGILIGSGIGIYLFNMPHRDIQSLDADYALTSSEIVAEYLNNKAAANNKYLSVDGNSKILEVTGTIKKISENYNGDKVVLLKENDDKAGVSATFTQKSNLKINGLQLGATVTIKGVIRSGASYDEDLEIYENVILEKCDVVEIK